MNKNIGIAGRVIRTMAAVVIALLYYFDVIPGAVCIVLILLAGILLLTSFVRFCPIYAPFGWSTCATANK